MGCYGDWGADCVLVGNVRARTHVSKIGRFPPSIFFWSSVWMLVVGYADIRYSRT